MLDHTNLKILEELSRNSRISMKELREKIHLSGTAASARVEKLENSGKRLSDYSVKIIFPSNSLDLDNVHMVQPSVLELLRSPIQLCTAATLRAM